MCLVSVISFSLYCAVCFDAIERRGPLNSISASYRDDRTVQMSLASILSLPNLPIINYPVIVQGTI